MKYDTSIKNQLGLIQEEMAMALLITISQWSMYKSGMRNIPIEAENRMADMLLHAQEGNKISKARQKLVTAETEKAQQQLQQDYRSVQLKLQRVAKKISILENTRSECFAALEAAAFLENQKEKHPITGLAESIRIRASKTLQEHNLYGLTALQLKHESLELLKNNIAKKIKAEENKSF